VPVDTKLSRQNIEKDRALFPHVAAAAIRSNTSGIFQGLLPIEGSVIVNVNVIPLGFHSTA
jgi:hypothetical protein